MALKVLSGRLLPKMGYGTAGEATVEFASNTVSGNAASNLLNTVGATGDFIDTPCQMVAIGNFAIHLGQTTRGSASAVVSSIDNMKMTIKWQCTEMSEIQNITYMVIGEVAEKEEG